MFGFYIQTIFGRKKCQKAGNKMFLVDGITWNYNFSAFASG